MARAITLHKLGEPHEALRLLYRPKPEASPGRVVVRITLRPVNPTDLITLRAGSLLNVPQDYLPPVIGSEGFGIVEQVNFSTPTS